MIALAPSVRCAGAGASGPPDDRRSVVAEAAGLLLVEQVGGCVAGGANDEPRSDAAVRKDLGLVARDEDRPCGAGRQKKGSGKRSKQVLRIAMENSRLKEPS